MLMICYDADTRLLIASPLMLLPPLRDYFRRLFSLRLFRRFFFHAMDDDILHADIDYAFFFFFFFFFHVFRHADATLFSLMMPIRCRYFSPPLSSFITRQRCLLMLACRLRYFRSHFLPLSCCRREVRAHTATAVTSVSPPRLSPACGCSVYVTIRGNVAMVDCYTMSIFATLPPLPLR